MFLKMVDTPCYNFYIGKMMENEANPRWMWQAAIRPGCKVGYEMEAYGGVLKWGSPKHPKLDHFSIETRGYVGLCGAMRGYAVLCGPRKIRAPLLPAMTFHIQQAFTHRSFYTEQAFT